MKIKYTDLFCGVGGFRLGAEAAFRKKGAKGECVFSSDIDERCRESYRANFGGMPYGDITKLDEKTLPDFNLLFAGFPCQPFSIIGSSKGFDDTRGTLFFDIARILDAKKPEAFLLENVRRLVSHNNGHTFKRILETLENLGYYVDYKILNALDFGLPQKRERVFIAGFARPHKFNWPAQKMEMAPLENILEKNPGGRHFASGHIRKKRAEKHKSRYSPAIWHENKSGNIASYPYSCALRAGASYNYLLVDGLRRLTPREMFRLQGFPDSYKITSSDFQARKQAGNAVPVPVVSELIFNMLDYFKKPSSENNFSAKPAEKVVT